MKRNDPRAQQLLDAFEMLGDWEERYRYLIELGRQLPPLPPEAHNEINRVRGCMSQVWLKSREEPGPTRRLWFSGDSDAHIVKGLIALLFKVLDGRPAREILEIDITGLFEELGLESHITVNRRNGFYAMVERIKSLAQGAESGNNAATSGDNC